jgi:hypothetical protein
MENKDKLKNKVLGWLKENNVDIGKKRVRVYSYRGEPEVRIYNEPMEWTNTKKSRRMWKEADQNGNNCTFGIHTRMVSTFVHISEKDLEDKAEAEFILEMLTSNN